MQVERRTGKVRRPETDVLPLCHATASKRYNSYKRSEIQIKITEIRARSRRLAHLCGQNHDHTQFPKCCCRRPQDVQRCAVCSHQPVSLDTHYQHTQYCTTYSSEIWLMYENHGLTRVKLRRQVRKPQTCTYNSRYRTSYSRRMESCSH